jgi:cytochrome P450
VPNAEDMTDEAFTILSAGADTTGHVMAIATYYVLSNPDVHQKLIEELNQAFPSSEAHLNYSKLEELPYLTGVIKETLRLSSPIPGRLPRRIDTNGEVFNGYNIPKGTIVGMSAAMVHKDPKVFEDPEAFEPERWADTEQAKRLDKYLVAFSKGSRQCIGIQ